MALVRSGAMVGRDAELSALLALAEEARQGQGSVVLVTGEAGVGKSRLLEELAGRLEEADLLVVGHGVDLDGGEVPFGALGESLRDLLRQEGLEAVRDALGPGAGHLSGVVPALGVSDRVDRTLVFAAALALLDRLSEDRLLCWVLDDVQWVDALTWELFSIAAAAVGTRKQLLVATERLAASSSGAARVGGLQAQVATRSVWLGRLDDEAVLGLVSALGRSDVPPQAGARIVELSGGLPFHVEQLTANLDYVTARLPPSLTQIILARLPRLSPAAGFVVASASLGSEPLDLPSLMRVTQLPRDVFVTSLDEAVGAGILEAAGRDSKVRFVHALVRETVAEGLLPSQRLEIHEAWARTLQASGTRRAERVFALAHHWLHTGNALEALPTACRAARLASELGDSLLESVQWEHALSLWDEVPDGADIAGVTRAEMLYSLAIATMATGRWADFDKRAADELAMAGPMDDSVGHVWLALCREGIRERLTGTLHMDEPTVRRRATTLLQAAPDLRVVDALERNAKAARRFDRGLAAQQHEAALAMSVALNHPKAVLRAAVFVGFDPDARAHPRSEADRLAGLSAEFEDAPVADRLLITTVQMEVLVGAGFYQEAIEVAEQALAPVGSPQVLPIRVSAVTLQKIRAHMALGEWDVADRLLHVVEQVSGYEVEVGSTSAALAMLRGKSLTEAARDSVDPISGFSLDAFDDQPYLGDLIQLLYALGDARGARDVWSHLRGDPRQWRPATVWPALNAAMRAETMCVRRFGKQDGAPEVIEHIAWLADVLEWECPAATAFRAEHGALAALHRDGDTPADWDQAASSWAAIGRRFDEGLCRLRLSEALVRVGDRREGLAEALSAHRLAEVLGADGLTAEIATFARRARLPLSSSDSWKSDVMARLTDRELEVLRLVADGLSNGDIASKLFMSPKTASVHVSRILAKLHARNRTEAAAIARREQLLG